MGEIEGFDNGRGRVMLKPPTTSLPKGNKKPAPGANIYIDAIRAAIDRNRVGPGRVGSNPVGSGSNKCSVGKTVPHGRYTWRMQLRHRGAH